MKSAARKQAINDGIAPTSGEEVAALFLDHRGMIRGCNAASESLFSYRRSELVWQHVSMLLPQLAELDLLQNGRINGRLRFLCRIGRSFDAVAQGGKQFASELFLNLLGNDGSRHLTLLVRPAQIAAATHFLQRPLLRRVAG